MNIVEILLKVALLGGGWVLWLLLTLSVLSVGLVLERLWFFRRHARSGGESLRAAVARVLEDGDPAGAERVLRESTSYEGRVLSPAFAYRKGGAKAFTDALESEMARRRRDLEAGTNFLGTLGSNAPFIGLFGTVIGVIVAFHELGSAAARAGAMGGVMSGIAESLVATGVGLFVAIPAVIAYNVMQKRIGDLEQDAISLGKLISAWIEANPESRAHLRVMGD
jgi:biopolymer transport protein ExbB/biopolymer transport protein TolQ